MSSLPTIMTKSQIEPLPPEMSRRVETILSRLRPSRNLRSHSIAERDAPTDAERGAIAGHLTLLEGAMVAAEKPTAMKYLAAMFLGFPSVKMDEAEAVKTLALYHSQIAGQPLFAIKEGCEAMMRRNSPFPPSVGQLYHACIAASNSVAREANRLTSILQAEVIPEPAPMSAEDQARWRQDTDALLRRLGCSTRMISAEAGGEPDHGLTEEGRR